MPQPQNLKPHERESLRVQFQGLRDEITSRNNAIVQIQAFTVLAFGTILTLAYSDKALAIGRNLILFYSIIALFSYCIYFSNKSVIYSIGKFIRDIDENYTYKDKQDELSWEHHGVAELQWFRFFRWLAVGLLYLGTELLAFVAAWFFPPTGAPQTLGGDPGKPGYLHPIMLVAWIIVSFSTLLALVFLEDWSKYGSLLGQSAEKKKKVDDAKSIVQTIQGKQFGKLISKGLDKISDEKEVVRLEDNKYEYQVEPSSREIVKFGIKNSEISKFLKTMSSSKLTREDAISKSKPFLGKYSSGKTMEFVRYSTKVNNTHDIHIVSYEGNSPNGVRTGEFVDIWINQDGELVLYARHKGNSIVA